ncbi:MAG: hypothetical protein IKS41_02500 [Alphaproteobacteria bacterium]|nr:hypothetical protein [Alphaproteobacteria bacterium]
MEGSLLKRLGIPVQEVVLSASNTKNQGILIQETLPSFSLYTKDNLRIDVPGIPCGELVAAFEKDCERYMAITLKKEKKQTNHLWQVLEKYIRAVPNCPKDISFAKGALIRFFREYRNLRNENIDMSAIIRSAIQEGIHFDFYEKGNTSGGGAESLQDSVAQYSSKRRTVEFNCAHYFTDPKRTHNTLAHELCHYIMDDKGKGGYFGTFFESDIGRFWYEMMKSEAFYGKKEWDKAKKELSAEGKDLYGTSSFFTHLASEYRPLLKGYPDPAARMGEMFARVMGIMAERKKGIAVWEPKDMKRMGLQLICDLAAAKANRNEPFYRILIDTIQKTKISPRAKEQLLALKGCQEEITEKGTYTTHEYKAFRKHSSDLAKTMCAVYTAFLEAVRVKRIQQSSPEQIQAEDTLSDQAGGFYDRLAKSSDVRNGRISFRQAQKKRAEAKQAPQKYPLVPISRLEPEK